MREFEIIEKFLGRPNFDGFSKDDLFIKTFIEKGWGQDIAALSNMAEALANAMKSFSGRDEELPNLMQEIVVRATHPTVNPYGKPLDLVPDLGKYGYYLEHLNIVLGSFQRAVDARYKELNTRVSQHLLDLSNNTKHLHAVLLPYSRMRWAADQAGIIYSLWLYDQNNRTSLHEDLAEHWLNRMDTIFRHKETNLYMTEVTRAKKYSQQPRGCSLAYMVYYMSFFAREEAEKQWSEFKVHMFVDKMWVSGFREWLPNYKGKWTPDSGPILWGIGVGATGLALKTSAALEDEFVFDRIIRVARPVSAFMRLLTRIPLLKIVGRLGGDLLASSILYCAKTDRANRKAGR